MLCFSCVFNSYFINTIVIFMADIAFVFFISLNHNQFNFFFIKKVPELICNECIFISLILFKQISDQILKFQIFLSMFLQF